MWAFIGMLVVIGWAELEAIVVGVAGLRRVTGGPTPGGARLPVVSPTPARPSPPEDEYIMGTPPASWAEPPLIGEVPPSPGDLLGKPAPPARMGQIRKANRNLIMGRMKVR